MIFITVLEDKLRNIPLRDHITRVLRVIVVNIVLTAVYFFAVSGEFYLRGTGPALMQSLLVLVKLGLFIYILLFLRRFLVDWYDFHRADTLLVFLILLNVLITYFTLRGMFSAAFVMRMFPVIIAVNIVWGLSICILGLRFLQIPEPQKLCRNVLGVSLILAGLLFASQYLALYSFIPALLADIALLRLLWLIRLKVINS